MHLANAIERLGLLTAGITAAIAVKRPEEFSRMDNEIARQKLGADFNDVEMGSAKETGATAHTIEGQETV